ncbi:segregation and condensation protein A [Aureispira anguillae]|uniref:Segregation and condensation protein A n=1 Tax=Aureispira anguillae TaxID=2864201 RepID=A0A916DTS2_9BACT|nr:segregation/condensation protein A [Aureispira anguillae]BDS12040.1 segregation/condensation protein A [Aureispira anguillae]
MTYKIKLPEFEGPFDLLLFFIERDELDIYDIPISSITNDFLEYLREMEELNIDTASEFILVASTLMRIKAKMLLPRKELDEEGNEIDPRAELVERLLEYRRYKEVLEELRTLEATRAAMAHRGNVVDEVQQVATAALADAELENLSLFRLLQAYERIMSTFEFRMEKTIHTVVHFHYTIEERRDFLLNSLNSKKKMTFKGIFSACENRLHAIFTFLAILDLMQQERIIFVEGAGGFNDFELKAVESMEDQVEPLDQKEEAVNTLSNSEDHNLN